MLIDIEKFVEERGEKAGEDLKRQPVSEWFAEHTAPIAAVGTDGCYSLISNRGSAADINVIMANDLGGVDSNANYHVCKSDMRDSWLNRAAWLRGKEKQKPLTAAENFFWISEIIEIEKEG